MELEKLSGVELGSEVNSGNLTPSEVVDDEPPTLVTLVVS